MLYRPYFVNNTSFSMFCRIHQDSEVESLANVAEEVGNDIIPVRSCTDLVFLAQSKSYKIALHQNTLNVPTVVLEQQQSITMETEMLPVQSTDINQT